MTFAQRPRLLLVDDEPMILALLEDYLLADLKYDVLTAGDGADAIACLNEKNIDLAIIDMNLPDTTGTELILAIKKRSDATRFLLFTGSLEYKIPESLRQLGIGEEHLIHKPLKSIEIIGSLVEKQLLSRL